MSRSSTALIAALALFAAQQVVAQSPTISSPNLYECTPAAYAYTCTNTPCTVVARPSTDAAQTTATLGSVTEASGTLSWTVSVAEGTEITVYITDSEGNVGNNSPTTVAAGSTSCLSASGSSASSSAASTSAAAGSSSSAAGSSSSSAAPSSSSAASSSSSKTSSSASSSASKVASSTSSISSSLASVASSASSAVSSATGSTASASATTSAASGASHVAATGFLAAVLAVGAALFA
ncbi:hypothetical protein JCM5296_000402 [Sporobolomyces johnsonii]